jgi:hypothetical protein
VGLWREPPGREDIRAMYLKRCARVTRNLELNYITPKEASNSLFDILQHMCMAGDGFALESCVEALPEQVMRDLLAVVLGDPGRIFKTGGPQTTDEAVLQDMKRRAAEVSRVIADCLEERIKEVEK